jgi:hypothetical protein
VGGALKEAHTKILDLDTNQSFRRTGGIEIDDDFRPRVDPGVSNKLYCVSVPFLLHKLPFVQGITSAHEMGMKVSSAIISSLGGETVLSGLGQASAKASPIEMEVPSDTVA